MGKDLVEYRQARKFALGSESVETCVGATTTRYCSGLPRGSDVRTAAASRPLALMKWAFDDYVVEEQLPESLCSSSSGSHQGMSAAPCDEDSSVLIPLLSEGVPDRALARLLRETGSLSSPVHFLSPVDFVSCARRYAWVRTPLAKLSASLKSPQLLHTSHGDVRLGAPQPIAVPSSSKVFPLHHLPAVRYTVLLRHVNGSLGNLLPQLRSLAKNGFINYYHLARHGLGAARAYEDGKRLLRRDYHGFLEYYLRSLTEGTTAVQRELPLLLEVLADPRARHADWNSVMRGLEYATKADRDAVRWAQTGLYSPHHAMLKDFVNRAADIAPVRHDSAQLIRECISRLVIQEKLHCLSEVFFNSLASLRLALLGDEVVVGDLVAPCAAGESPNELCADVFDGAADHLNGEITSSVHQPWEALDDARDQVERYHASIRVVTTSEEARQYALSHVVLPFYGRGVEALPVMPQHHCGKLFNVLARELQMEGLPLLTSAARASYRHLIATPRQCSFHIFDAQRGWCWGEGPAADQLKASLYQDQEGVFRLRSPVTHHTLRTTVARRGIRDPSARSAFTKPARKGGMNCALQLTLPRGSPVTSALREAFQFSTLSPSALFRLMS